MVERERFLMYLTMGISIAIVANSFVHKDTNLVQNLLTVLAYWMPSPMSNSNSTIKPNSDNGDLL